MGQSQSQCYSQLRRYHFLGCRGVFDRSSQHQQLCWSQLQFTLGRDGSEYRPYVCDRGKNVMMCGMLIMNSILSMYAAAISILEFRRSKRTIADAEKAASDRGKSSDGEAVALTSVSR